MVEFMKLFIFSQHLGYVHKRYYDPILVHSIHNYENNVNFLFKYVQLQ